MTGAEVLSLVSNLRVWTRGDERAPHKPLLLLYALGRCARGEPREMAFADVERDVGRLLREFGPSRKSYHPEYPFWRLQHDDLWVVADGGALAARAGNTDPKKSELLRYDVHGGLPPGVFDALRADRPLLIEVARRLLDASFPESLHEEIATAVGLDLAEGSAPRRRDPAFRTRMLRAYEFRCAVCGYDLRLGDVHVGLEAAHIKWHQAGGPDDEANGFALCSLHHKAFDLGAFTIGDHLELRLSASLHGGEAFERVFLAHHGRAIRQPPDPGHRPGEVFLAWHRREVFRAPERWVG